MKTLLPSARPDIAAAVQAKLAEAMAKAEAKLATEKARTAVAALSESGGEAATRYQFGNHHAKQITEDWMPWHAGQPDYPDGPTREEIARKYPHFAHLHSLPSSQQNAYYNSNVEVIRRETQGVNSELEKLPACPLTLQHHSMERIEAAEFMKANAVGIARELRAFRAVLSRNNHRLERIYRADAATRNQEKARKDQEKQTSRR